MAEKLKYILVVNFGTYFLYVFMHRSYADNVMVLHP